MAMFVITGQNEDKDFWNDRIAQIPAGKRFRVKHPAVLVFVGLYALHETVMEFRKQTLETGKFFESKELLANYDGFTEAERNDYNFKYRITESVPASKFDELMKMTMEFQKNMRSTAEAQQNGPMLEICEKMEKDMAEKFGTHQIEEKSDEEMDYESLEEEGSGDMEHDFDA